jgi:hypothetical protein
LLLGGHFALLPLDVVSAKCLVSGMYPVYCKPGRRSPVAAHCGPHHPMVNLGHLHWTT